MVAALDDAAMIEHHNGVGIAHGREAVGDDEDRAPFHEAIHALFDQRLRARVDGRGRLVEDCAVVRQNLKAAGLFEKASVAETAAEMYLAACRERFDLVLLDPPYRQGTVAALLPAVAAVTAPGGTVLAETEHGASLPERCGTLTLKKQYKYGTVALARYEADAEF